MNLTHENSLLQEINNLSASGKIQDSVALTAQGVGSGLTAQEAEIKIRKLIPTTRQRINAAKFYLDTIESMNYVPYLGSQPFLPEEQKPLIDFLDSDLRVQINVSNSDLFPLIIFIVLNGFFSNLVSSEDCVSKIINIVYDLLQNDRLGYKIRQKLETKRPNGTLTAHLRTFHAIGQDGKPDKAGSPFNIAKEIRNQLTHDDIVVSFSAISLSGSVSAPKLHFRDSFFAPNTNSPDTEMTTFCQNAYDKTVNFVDGCYRLICEDLQRNGAFPV